MGYVRGFVHGGVVGVVVGLCVAPQTGTRTREQLSGFAEAARDGYQIAERTFRRVAPLAGAAAGVARDQVEQALHNDDAGSEGGAVHIHNQTNGRR
ncbi:MAG: hypothetical protein M3R48_09230 [Candidatus Dormibacteraeota bacterium]|nr:hypothetical protein [Candidatus Dormibacteraeota bacterium]